MQIVGTVVPWVVLSRATICCITILRPTSSKERKHFGTNGSRGSGYGYSFEKVSFHMKAVDLKFGHLPFPKGKQQQGNTWSKREKLLKIWETLCKGQICRQKMDLINSVMEIAWNTWENTTRSMKLEEEKGRKGDPGIKFVWIGNVEEVSTIL